MDEKVKVKNDPEMEYDYSKFAGQGLEDAPLPPMAELKIMQPTTPGLLDKDTDLFGISPGLIRNMSTGVVAPDIAIIPIYMRNLWNVWIPLSGTKREFVGSYEQRPFDTTYTKGKGLFTKTGEVVEKGVILVGLQHTEGVDFELAHIRFFRRQNITGRKIIDLLTLAPNVKAGQSSYIPPAYSREIFLSTGHQKDKGYEWFDWMLNPIFQWLSPATRLFKQSQASQDIARRLYNALLVDRSSTPVIVDAVDDIPF